MMTHDETPYSEKEVYFMNLDEKIQVCTKATANTREAEGRRIANVGVAQFVKETDDDDLSMIADLQAQIQGNLNVIGDRAITIHEAVRRGLAAVDDGTMTLSQLATILDAVFSITEIEAFEYTREQRMLENLTGLVPPEA